jgi:hypothetical protein
MKKALYIIVMVVLVAVWANPASAIDRSKKNDPSPNQKRPLVDKPSQDRGKTIPDSKAPQNKESRKKNYDDFVDRNNNGIDDRVEKSTKPSKPKKPDTSRKKKAPDKPNP